MLVTLTSSETAVLFRKVPHDGEDGGFQALIESLGSRLDKATGQIELTAADLERIPRYAFDYKQGAWQERLVGVFGRALGAKLGR